MFITMKHSTHRHIVMEETDFAQLGQANDTVQQMSDRRQTDSKHHTNVHAKYNVYITCS